MGVTCAKCGEELLGAVNRCWRCGTEFVPHRGETDVPPVRQTPLDGLEQARLREAAPLDAEVVPGDVPPSANAVGTPIKTAFPGGDDRPRVARAQPSPRDGKMACLGGEEGRPIRSEVHPRRFSLVSIGARYRLLLGIASIIFGLTALPFSFSSIWALPVSLFGLAVGVWGLCGARGGLAMAGILLCCSAFTVSGYRGLIAVYTWYAGHSPFDHRPVEDISGPEDPIDEDWTEEDWLRQDP